MWTLDYGSFQGKERLRTWYTPPKFDPKIKMRWGNYSCPLGSTYTTPVLGDQ